MAEEYRGPFGLRTLPKTRLGSLGQGILSVPEAMGDVAGDIIDLPQELGAGILNYLTGPSEFSRDVSENQLNPEYKGIDLADIPGSGVGRPDFAQAVADELGSIEGLKIAEMPFDTPSKTKPITGPGFEGLGPQDITALEEIKKINDKRKKEKTATTLSAQSKPEQISALDFRKQEAERAGIDFKTGKPKGLGEADVQKTLESAFISALQDTEKSRGDKPPKGESREDALARYKKEFEEATGIDASGKVDKSRALMAFGLALMQNKAGKGFNVGKMLQSVGEAGEAAVPQLDKAISRAEAAKLAAGKYALDQLAVGESAAAALAKENREASRAFYLKMLELDIQAEKDKREDSKIRNIDRSKIIDGVEIAYGTSNQETKLAKPSADATLVSNAWNKYSKGQENINKMLGLVEDLSQENAPAFKTIGDRIKKQLGNFGLRDPKIDFGAEGASDEDKFNAMRLSVINEMKRLIIQESQVSDYDRQMLNESFGNIDITSTPQQAEFALNEMLTYFNGKKNSLVPVLQQMYDPSYFLTNDEYNRTVGYLKDSLEVPFISPQVRNRNGSTTTSAVATVDLTGSK